MSDALSAYESPQSPAADPLKKAPAKRRGFRLVELLVVVAIIGILAALILPAT